MLIAQGSSISVQVSGCDRDKTNISTLQSSTLSPDLSFLVNTAINCSAMRSLEIALARKSSTPV
jgi:hypothetical protein